jgi:hypothetical protein
MFSEFFEKQYCPHLLNVLSPSSEYYLEPVHSSEKSVNIYQAKRQHITQDNIQELQRFLGRRHSHSMFAFCLHWAHLRETCHEIHSPRRNYNQCIAEWTGMISWHSTRCLWTTNYKERLILGPTYGVSTLSWWRGLSAPETLRAMPAVA